MKRNDIQSLIRELKQPADSRIILLVADGLGGLPAEGGELTELESADTPHLDELARQGTTGLLHPVLPGITCGSGPGHLALFGYDPLRNRVGRGVLSSLGVDFDLSRDDVAARGNFCSVDDEGKITDRRAGRLPDSEGRRLVEKLRQIEIDGIEVFVEHVKQYRFTLIFRGDGLDPHVGNTDPHVTGVEACTPEATDDHAESTATMVGRFIDRAREILSDEPAANMIILRGFSSRPDLPSMKDVYGLNSCASAIYPMYRGLSRLLGMTVPEKPDGIDAQLGQVESMWEEHDFFFIHHKDSDSTGEDGDFDRKVEAIEELDAAMPRLLDLKPDVLIVTGDHSTPSRLKSHSWHPVPVLLSAATCRPDRVEIFGERAAISGGLGQFEAVHLMSLAMAHAGRLEKFSA